MYTAKRSDYNIIIHARRRTAAAIVKVSESGFVCFILLYNNVFYFILFIYIFFFLLMSIQYRIFLRLFTDDTIQLLSEFCQRREKQTVW